MIKLIFTLDYEIFGDGSGDLKNDVYDPTESIKNLFDSYNYKFVNFVEAAEFLKIKELKTDNYLQKVENQIRNLYNDNHEIGLHIHPQWFNAVFNNNRWSLDNDEYNLCLLEEDKIRSYVKSSINYLREVLGYEGFNPISFRAGNWLIQPSNVISKVLIQENIKLDSSVFKNGYQSKHKLDFKNAPKNFYWKFQEDVLKPSKSGELFEIPIYSINKPIFHLFKKVKHQANRKIISNNTLKKNIKDKLYFLRDILRFNYPFKMDFTKSTFKDIKQMIDNIPEVIKTSNSKYPIVLIGHCKNLPDISEIDSMLSYIKKNNLEVTTLANFYLNHLQSNSENH